MKLSKRSDIAIQILLYLRNNKYINVNFKSAQEMSSDLNLSYNNIRKILSILNDLGYIHSKLGQNGGIALTPTYNQISIKFLLLELEEFEANKSKINCEVCNITPSCKFVNITRFALMNFFNTYTNVYLDDL